MYVTLYTSTGSNFQKNCTLSFDTSLNFSQIVKENSSSWLSFEPQSNSLIGVALDRDLQSSVKVSSRTSIDGRNGTILFLMTSIYSV